MPVNLIISMNIFLLARDLNLLKNKLLLNYIICVLNFNSVPLNVFSAPSSSWTHFYVATSFGAIFKLNILLSGRFYEKSRYLDKSKYIWTEWEH